MHSANKIRGGSVSGSGGVHSTAARLSTGGGSDYIEDHHRYIVLPSDNYDEKVASRDYSDIAREERRKCINAARAVRIAMRASTNTSTNTSAYETGLASDGNAVDFQCQHCGLGTEKFNQPVSAPCGRWMHRRCRADHYAICDECQAADSTHNQHLVRSPAASEAGDGSHVAAYVHAKQELEHPEEDICRSLRWPSSVPSQATDPQAPEAVPQAVVLTALVPSDRLHVADSASHGVTPRLLPNTNQSSFTFSLPFTLQKAHRLRGRGGPGCYHNALREHLKTVSASDGMRPLRIEVSDELPWREYIANHASYDSLIGTGVEDFFLQFRRKSDPNRGGKSRLDFVIKRCDGSHVLLHPGTKRNNDAQPIVLNPGQFEELI